MQNETILVDLENAKKISAGLLLGRGGRRFVVIGSKVYWDPQTFGINAMAVVPISRHFVVHDGFMYFPVDDLTKWITDEDVTIDRMEANLVATVVERA